MALYLHPSSHPVGFRRPLPLFFMAPPQESTLEAGRRISRLPFRDPDDDDLTNCWTLPDITSFNVRGSSYCNEGDRRKIKVASKPAALEVVAVDTVRCDEDVTDIAGRPGNIVQLLKDRGMHFLVVNWMLPNHMNVVVYFEVPQTRPDHWSDNFAELLRRFTSADEDDEYRKCRFKLIPRIVKGPWLVKTGVGSKPAIVGNKLKQTYARGENYFEVDIDVNSTRVGASIWGLVNGAVKNLVFEMCLVIQGNTPGELPEHVLGGVTLPHCSFDSLPHIDEPLDYHYTGEPSEVEEESEEEEEEEVVVKEEEEEEEKQGSGEGGESLAGGIAAAAVGDGSQMCLAFEFEMPTGDTDVEDDPWVEGLDNIEMVETVGLGGGGGGETKESKGNDGLTDSPGKSTITCCP